MKTTCLTLVGIGEYYGNHTMKGYCFLHDREYKLVEPDDVCPQCLADKEKDLRWRDEEANE